MKKFTLIELLVVVAIIGILASLLMPSLQKAREQAILKLCLSNVKQWCTGSVLYHDDNDKFWDLNNYPYRSSGKRGNTGWGSYTVQQRPVNDYLNYTVNGSEVAAAHCPKDTYWRVDMTSSSYDTLGTSYCDNMAWNTISRRSGDGSKSLKGRTISDVKNPSKCLLFMEWPIVSQSYRPTEDFPNWHLKQNFYNVGMVDGSAHYINVQVGQSFNDSFHFEYNR